MFLVSRSWMSKTRKCMQTWESYTLFSSVGSTKVTGGDWTPFVAISSIKKKKRKNKEGQMKLTVVVQQREKGFVFQSCLIQVQASTRFCLFLLQSRKSPENGWPIMVFGVFLMKECSTWLCLFLPQNNNSPENRWLITADAVFPMTKCSTWFCLSLP